MIPLKPEIEYQQDIKYKDEKIEEFMDEVLEKDTQIDQQAVLNKSIQKKLDAANKQLDEHIQTESKLTVELGQ